jgi:hypothetical protein
MPYDQERDEDEGYENQEEMGRNSEAERGGIAYGKTKQRVASEFGSDEEEEGLDRGTEDYDSEEMPTAPSSQTQKKTTKKKTYRTSGDEATRSQKRTSTGASAQRRPATKKKSTTKKRGR